MTQPYEIEIYQTAVGKEPYTEWEKGLDKSTMARIDARLARFEKRGASVNVILLEMEFMS